MQGDKKINQHVNSYVLFILFYLLHRFLLHLKYNWHISFHHQCIFVDFLGYI